MNATQTANPLERTITFSLSVAAIDTEIANRMRNLARNVRLQGFRPGKAPLKMVERMYGMQVRQEVMSDQLGESFGRSVDSQKLRVAGQPQIEAVEPTPGIQTNEIQFKATFEVYPEIAVGDLANHKLVKHDTTIDAADVDRTLETLRKQRTTFSPVDRAAANGDLVNVDFAGTLEGAAFDGGSAKGFGFVIGEGRMLPDFEAGALGLAAGANKTFPVAFPPDYAAENLRGKSAEFTITVNTVSEPKLPPLDAEFARTLGVADGDIEKLRAEVQQNLEREAKKRIINLTKDQVMDALVASTEFAVPKALVDNEVARMQQGAVQDLKARGMTTENMALPAELFQQGAERRVRLGLLIGEVIRGNNLTADAKSVRAMIEEHAESFEQPAELVKWYYTQPDKMAEVEALVLESKVVEWCVSRMQVESKATPFTELMANAQATQA